MYTENKYKYLLQYETNETDHLVESVYDVIEQISKNKIDSSEKKEFFSVMKEIIQRGDFTSYSCVNLFRDIMTDDMYDFMLEELKKEIFKNEPLTIEIMKIITVANYKEYYSFLDSVKNNSSVSFNLRKLIRIILDFENGKIKYFSFPLINQKSMNSTILEIDWSI